MLTIGAEPGPVVRIRTTGAAVQSLEITCGDGRRRDVVLAHDTVRERLASGDYIGGTIGRYANRIAGGRFELDDRTFCVPTNDRGNALHGGPNGFDRRTWSVVEHTPTAAALALLSPDGDMGFPGTLHAQVRYEVTGDEVSVTHTATTDAPTVVCLTNHAYLNLGDDLVTDHRLTVHADAYLPIDDTGLPLGPAVSVDGTPFDLREPAELGSVVAVDHEQVRLVGGIDHNLLVAGTGLREVAVLESPVTRTRVEIRSDQPGLQVYTGNALDGSPHPQHGGVALEPQVFPDSPNHPQWPSARLDPGEQYVSRLSWRFVRA